MAHAGAYGAIVLDVMLPKVDGFEVCRRLRADGVWAPILMLTARDAVDDRITGLDAGADDYLAKPFSFDELLARLRALIRRAPVERPAVLEAGDLRLDPAARRAWRGSTELDLSAKELTLLELFLRRPGVVLSRDQLLEGAWDMAFESRSNVVDVSIRSLRQKIDRPFGTRLDRDRPRPRLPAAPAVTRAADQGPAHACVRARDGRRPRRARRVRLPACRQHADLVRRPVAPSAGARGIHARARRARPRRPRRRRRDDARAGLRRAGRGRTREHARHQSPPLPGRCAPRRGRRRASSARSGSTTPAASGGCWPLRTAGTRQAVAVARSLQPRARRSTGCRASS